MNQSFCALPWKHLHLNAEGSAQICCHTDEAISEDGVPLSLYEHSLDDIWNSPYMREIRRAMIAGERLRACASCYRAEDFNGCSYRTQSNERWLGAESGEDKEAVIAATMRDDYRVQDTPIYFQMIPGNNCNLKCRMCNSSYSSQIERDPVHSRWAPLIAAWKGGRPRWRGNEVLLGPLPVRGVSASGWTVEEGPDGPRYWTGANATLSIGLRHPAAIAEIEIALEQAAFEPMPLSVSLNGVEVANLTVEPGYSGRVKVSHVPLTDTIDLSLRSVGRGVQVASVKAFRETGRKVLGDGVLGGRFATDAPWYEQDELVFGELLRRPDKVRLLYFTGGEPFLTPAIERMLDHLIATGDASGISLQFNTNCTRVDEAFLSKLKQFRHVVLCLSVDAEGATYDYMRYPARWTVVRENLRRMRDALPEAEILGVPILQAYNALNISDLCRFFDSEGLPFGLFHLYQPSYLAVGILPQSARSLGAERLRAYAATAATEAGAAAATEAARYFETVNDRCTPENLKRFMLFTNDLDRGRRQDFGRTFPELLALIQATGFDWTEETRHVA